MICTNCGIELSDDMKFCISCGAPVQQVKMVYQEMPQREPDPVCRSCGAPLIRGYKFCTACGAMASGEEAIPKAPDIITGREEPKIIEEPAEAVQVSDAAEYDEARDPGLHSDVPEAGTAEPDPDDADDATVTIEISVILLTDLDRPGVQYRAPIESEILIGRRRADIVIPDDREISRAHCRILLKEDGLYLVDTMSKNGTYYRDCRIVPNQEFQIDSGDIIRIGRHNFRVELVLERM